MLKWSSPLRFVKGLDAESAHILAARGLKTVEDLLYFPPRGYEDWTGHTPIAQASPGQTVTIVATVSNTSSRSTRAGPLFEAELAEGARRLRCRWFHSDYLSKVIATGQLLMVHGRIESDPLFRAPGADPSRLSAFRRRERRRPAGTRPHHGAL